MPIRPEWRWRGPRRGNFQVEPRGVTTSTSTPSNVRNSQRIAPRSNSDMPSAGSTKRSRSLASVSSPYKTEPNTRGFPARCAATVRRIDSRCWSRRTEGLMTATRIGHLSGHLKEPSHLRKARAHIIRHAAGQTPATLDRNRCYQAQDGTFAPVPLTPNKRQKCRGQASQRLRSAYPHCSATRRAAAHCSANAGPGPYAPFRPLPPAVRADRACRSTPIPTPGPNRCVRARPCHPGIARLPPVAPQPCGPSAQCPAASNRSPRYE